MKKSLTSFALHKTALTIALVAAVASLIFVIPITMMFFLVTALEQGNSEVSMGIGMSITMMVFMPFIYFVFGYISTIIFTAIYNLVAKYTGGIQFSLEDRNS